MLAESAVGVRSVLSSILSYLRLIYGTLARLFAVWQNVVAFYDRAHTATTVKHIVIRERNEQICKRHEHIAIITTYL